MAYTRSQDDGARYTTSANAAGELAKRGTSLQEAVSPLTGKADSTQAPNLLPTPGATGAATSGFGPGPKDPSHPGLRTTGVGSR